MTTDLRNRIIEYRVMPASEGASPYALDDLLASLDEFSNTGLQRLLDAIAEADRVPQHWVDSGGDRPRLLED